MVKHAIPLVVMTIIFLLSIASVKVVEGSTETPPLPPFNPRVDYAIQKIMNEFYIPSVATAVIRNNSII